MKSAESPSHAVVIIGGGAGGATVASLLLKARPDLDVAIIEPSETHWSQPAWTLVGAGAYDVEATGRPMATDACRETRRGRAAIPHQVRRQCVLD